MALLPRLACPLPLSSSSPPETLPRLPLGNRTSSPNPHVLPRHLSGLVFFLLSATISTFVSLLRACLFIAASSNGRRTPLIDCLARRYVGPRTLQFSFFLAKHPRPLPPLRRRQPLVGMLYRLVNLVSLLIICRSGNTLSSTFLASEVSQRQSLFRVRRRHLRCLGRQNQSQASQSLMPNRTSPNGPHIRPHQPRTPPVVP
ncbi:hypothetical protein FKP32DRAFT_82547 [Trametes sanguinea]|nr:hypothetical protein FKP32DRAFT_82547 [Trametes sanguinea]